MSTLELDALRLAENAHAGQARKYTGDPYIVHVLEVAGLVASVDHSPAMIAAAYLHDTLEDTALSPGTIEATTSSEVLALVQALTDVSREGDGNRATRKALDRDHLAAAPAAAQTIKLADLISNTLSIATHDPGFARVYLDEKSQLLDVLTRGDGRLHELAREVHAGAVYELTSRRGQRAG